MSSRTIKFQKYSDSWATVKPFLLPAAYLRWLHIFWGCKHYISRYCFSFFFFLISCFANLGHTLSLLTSCSQPRLSCARPSASLHGRRRLVYLSAPCSRQREPRWAARKGRREGHGGEKEAGGGKKRQSCVTVTSQNTRICGRNIEVWNVTRNRVKQWE